ncbi:hypothetical protein K443DRAFT_10610 [Laccaria amethystina LaAM-08-1]|uniref:Unplaced genomic scaffold K443scaffold_185, whole genome shotgun sequence n=1 Tax=Laccaria amethystina LaAM-08-1 TaxID=1095629 RepID=A0A0C9WKL3_9AGAR|nr:hypothetical protein K443DRAFT_10610 [Laccaria amethystina LaAM-08-1]
MHKSTHTILKTARAQQVQPESEEEDPATAAVRVTSANDTEDIYVDEEEEAALMGREEEEESDEDGEEEEVDKNHGDKGEQDDEEDGDEDNKPEIAQVLPQKRKQGKDAKKPTKHVNRHELEEAVETHKITYNIAIFSWAELARQPS